MFQGSSIHYVYCLFIQICSVGARRDQEGPGHFYDLTFLVKSVPSVRIILCHIEILHRYRGPYYVLVTVPDYTLLCITLHICPPTIFRNVRTSHQ